MGNDPGKEKQVLEILKLETLRQTDLFKEFSEPALKTLIKSCPDRHLDDGETLCAEGAMEDKMYILLSGKLEISKMKKRIDIAGPGEYLGEMSLIDSQSRSASVKAMGETLVMEIDKETFEKDIVHEPASFYSLLKTLSLRARHHLEVISADCQKLNCFAHDMRNIVSALDLPAIYLESLIKKQNESGHGSEEKKKDLNKLETSFKKVVAVKNNLVTLVDQSLSVTTRVKSDYIKKKGLLLPLIEEIVEELACHQKLHDKTLKINPPEISTELHFNRLDIKRVLQNLVINAGYACNKSDIIESSIMDSGSSIEVRVIDKGCGIPDDVKPHLLKTRYTTRADGNGFGLLSCREIIEDFHNGKFWFESEEGKGTTFFFRLSNENPDIQRSKGQ